MGTRFVWGNITENADPDGLNRVKVALKNEEQSVTDWIPVLTPYGSNDAGLSFIPEIDDQVLVASLETGDTRKAVIGSVWSNEVLPPETKENSSADLNGDGENSLRFFRSRAGSQLIFDDTEGSEKMQLLTAGGKSRLEFLAKDEKVSLNTENDLTIGAKGAISIQAEEVSITSKKKFDLNTEEYQVGAKKEIKITADKDMTVKGSGISLN